MRFWPYVAPLFFFSLLAGCAGTTDPTLGWSPQHLYHQAQTSLKNGNYTKAIGYFQTLEGRYPLGQYAQQAQLEVAYAYYKNSEPESAISAAQRFIAENPLSHHVDYAYYLIGLANFKSPSGLSGLLRPHMNSEVDVAPLRQSFMAFKELIKKFPHSRYAPDARRRMIYLRNELAAHELYVADYYMRRGAYIAVVNRCKTVLTRYPGAAQTDTALKLMAQAYDKLGMTGLADQTRQVLKLNLPQSATKTQG